VRLWGDEGEKRRVYEALWLARECERLGITHVHTHFAGVAARTAFWLRRLAGVRFSVTAHANDYFCDDSPGRLGGVFAASERVVTVSDFSVRDLRGKFPDCADKFVRVYNGIACAEFPAADPANARPVFVSVGRYIEKKGFPDLIQACASLGSGDWECHIVGQGPMEAELRERISDARLDGRVFLTGPKRESEVLTLLAGARAFVLPCVVEAGGGMDNLPTVIMEAMAAGLPVIATPLAGVPEMVIDGETGWLVPQRSPERLAEAMREVLANPSECARRGANGRKLCHDRFDLTVTAAALENVFIDHGAFESPRKRGLLSFLGR
jgi:glycosyltransferase involved in cell wall biosynthesis